MTVELTKEELQIIINALGSASPTSKELEVVQFKLYHRLFFKLNEK